ncbi:MAG: TM1802 family CRISPR-associated protein [Chitinophagales bacterium]
MLQTLSKIGEQLLEGKGVWARLTTEPKYNPDKKNWVCPILFDCVNKEIRFLKDEMELFNPDNSAIEHRYINPEKWGRRGKKCALTVEPKNFSMLEETLFGKKVGEDGSMIRSIEDLPNYTSKTIYKALKEINLELNESRKILDFTEFKMELNFGKNDEVVLFYSLIQSKAINDSKPTKLNAIDGFDDFIIEKFGSTKGNSGLDQLSGNYSNDVIEAAFQRGYNPNAIFQTSTFNFASNFSEFQKNFQIENKSTGYLDKGAQYVLKNLQARIAGISHIIIPNYMNKDLVAFNLDETELYLDKSSDLLFGYQSLEADIDRSLPKVGLFWINYIAFESDGNSFKIINHIKDVNSIYLTKLTEVFNRSGNDFKDYIGGKFPFNLQSVFNIIPVRDGNKSKVNLALNLFKDILEQKAVQPENLFKHFIELSLCHWYGRYSAFKNIRQNNSFDFAIKDAVFKYSALIFTLKQLNLLEMEKEISSQTEGQETSASDYQQRIQTFFDKMEYSEAEKALFYLGRILSSVAYAQYKKGHESKPVLNKINFNGMDADAIVRLSLDLREKTRQYNIHDKTEWNFSEFTDRFNEKNWPLSKEQNVFYLMAGYSFGLTKSDNN